MIGKSRLFPSIIPRRLTSSPSKFISNSSASSVTTSSSTLGKKFDTTNLFEIALKPELIKENITKYKSDSQTLARWLDVSVTQRRGKAYEPLATVVSPAQGIPFPNLDLFRIQSLLDNERTMANFPEDIKKDTEGPKVLFFSFKQYGFSLLRSWTDALLFDEESGGEKEACPVPIYEICFIEYSFLSMAKRVFAKNISNLIVPEQFPNTFIKFGGITDFAGTLLLPNVYTGYVFLLDKKNRIRWVNSGEATKEDLQLLRECIDKLKQEEI